jgi:hypothetical protein
MRLSELKNFQTTQSLASPAKDSKHSHVHWCYSHVSPFYSHVTSYYPHTTPRYPHAPPPTKQKALPTTIMGNAPIH